MFLVCAPGSVAWQPGPRLTLVARHDPAMIAEEKHAIRVLFFRDNKSVSGR